MCVYVCDDVGRHGQVLRASDYHLACVLMMAPASACRFLVVVEIKRPARQSHGLRHPGRAVDRENQLVRVPAALILLVVSMFVQQSTSWCFSIEAKETLDFTRSERIMVACASKKGGNVDVGFSYVRTLHAKCKTQTHFAHRIRDKACV